ncbi:hypothetical protein [Pseudomonas sp. zfem005]|uniref:hypothetical protein n=1 Tax=Pseudomonas sp. zfem005 TaxID=3078200 RepID=UPI0029284035|nr:hypothetical protein [Pseudomonas sp. zfem005]MDU9416185.1 hypothetical protein [Pseudomonas sp. zfem005]
MNTANVVREVVSDAISQIECSLERIRMLSASLHVIKGQLKQSTDFEHLAEVAALAAYSADDWHNILDCERERLTSRLDALVAGGDA